MEATVIDTVVEDNLIKIPQRFKNKRVKIIIIDQQEEEKENRAVPRKLSFKIDETLDDVIPFSDIEDSNEFAKRIRESHWQ